MFKPIRRLLLCGGVALMSLPAAITAHAERNYIYYFGDYNNWPTPSESILNSPYYQIENYRLYETEEGSNIYEGTVECNRNYTEKIHYFRFYKRLATIEETQSGVMAWYLNTLHPTWSDLEKRNYTKLGANDGYLPEGKGAYYESDIQFDAYQNNYHYDGGGGCWILPNTGKPVKFRVDLNANKLYIYQPYVAPLVNCDGIPSMQESTNHPDVTVSGTKVYIPAGECRLRIHDFQTGKTLGANPNIMPGNICTDKYIYKSNLIEGGDDIIIPNWGGGVLTFSDNRIDIENSTAYLNVIDNWGEDLYCVGDYCGWIISDDEKAIYEDGVFKGVINGATEWKFLAAKDWSSLQLDHDGGTLFGNTIAFKVWPSEFVPNFDYPLDGAYNYVVDIKKGLFYLWPITQSRPDAIPDEFINRDLGPAGNPFTGYFVSTPDDYTDLTAVKASIVAKDFKALTDNGDGTYSFRYDGSTPVRLAYFDKDEFKYYVTPTGDGEITMYNSGRTVDGYSRFITSTTDNGKYWSADCKRPATFTYNPQDTGLNGVTISYENSAEAPSIYLVGNLTGWIEPAESYEDHYSQYKLRKTTQGGYYGEFSFTQTPVMFRFYTELTGWNGGDSWGYQEDDNASELFFEENSSFNLVRGKGSYSFDIPAGDICIYADIDRGYMRVSREPMDVEYVDDAEPVADDYMCVIADDGRTRRLEKIADGVYSGDVTGVSDGNNLTGVRLFLAERPFPKDEPEWLGSYTVDFASDGIVPEFDEDGVAVLDITTNNAIGTTPANSMTLPNKMFNSYTGNMSLSRLIVDLNINKLCISNKDNVHLVGTLTNGNVPTLIDQANYRQAKLSDQYAAVIDLEAGDFIAKPYRTFYGRYEIPENYNQNGVTAEPEELEFINGVAKTTHQDNMHALYNIKMTDFPGGLIFLGTYNLKEPVEGNEGYYRLWSNTIVAQLDKIDHLIATTREKEHPLTCTDRETLTFKGTVKIPAPTNEYETAWIDLTTDLDPNISFGAKNVALVDGKAQAQLIPGAYSVYMPTVSEAELAVTVCLKDLSIEIEMIDGTIAQSYNLFSNEANNEAVMYESAINPGVASTTVAIDTAEENVEFNIGAGDGSVIVPADGDTDITFDANGSFTGDFKKIGSGSTQGVRRTLSTNSAKWSFKATEFDNVKLIVDENNNKITIISSNAITNRYAVVVDPTAIPYSKLSDIEKGVMTENADGTLSKTVNIPAGKSLKILGGFDYQGLYTIGASSRSYTNNLMVSFDENDEGVALIGCYDNNATPITPADNPGANYDVTVDYRNGKITLKRDSSGVESVVATPAIAIAGSMGCINITSDAECTVAIYNLQGALVRIVDVKAGTTRVDIAAGLYIVAGKKVLVK